MQLVYEAETFRFNEKCTLTKQKGCENMDFYTHDGVKVKQFDWYKVVIPIGDNASVLGQVGICISTEAFKRPLLMFPTSNKRLHDNIALKGSLVKNEFVRTNKEKNWVVDAHSLESFHN